jgi:hypothetical protein
MSLYGHRLLPPPLRCSELGLDWIVASQQFPCCRTAAKQAVLVTYCPSIDSFRPVRWSFQGGNCYC